MIPDVREELGFYHWVYISINLVKDDGVDKREYKVGVQLDPNEEDIEDVVLDDDREHHWRMALEENNGRVDGIKALLHANKWYVYNPEKEALVKGGY